MPAGSSKKRERQYEHIKESYEDRGVSTDEAEERAARTVNQAAPRVWRDEVGEAAMTASATRSRARNTPHPTSCAMRAWRRRRASSSP